MGMSLTRTRAIEFGCVEKVDDAGEGSGVHARKQGSAVGPACACYSEIQASFEIRPNNGFCYDGLYKVTACYKKQDENGYKILLFKLERIPGQFPVGTRGKFWTYPESDASTKMPEPTAPKKSLFPPRSKLPSFNKSSVSSYTLPSNWQQVALSQSYPTPLNSDSGAPLSPVPAVKVKKYCNDTLQYPVKAALSIPLSQYPEVDVKTRHSVSVRASPLRIKAESPPPMRKRPGSTLGDPLPRKRVTAPSNALRTRVRGFRRPGDYKRVGGKEGLARFWVPELCDGSGF
ncbi:hypothetical protein EV421DRAFT_1291722 [Armillaria borealis]|uniref:YDG domain-containing protein n=1 Tax=Armillaria borealis TaxID=47425 RepID=A0AA39JW59_9AGAR|nr:hypothetical protein EV421DRAFT_1291722 [Armillaria borealis]